MIFLIVIPSTGAVNPALVKLREVLQKALLAVPGDSVVIVPGVSLPVRVSGQVEEIIARICDGAGRPDHI